MIITTTNSVENAKIEKYLGVVTANLAIGTAYYSEFLISLTDFFGGLSDQYHREMDDLYQRAYDSITFKASKIGADAVLGFKIDFDEISGKGVQMIMISVSGTAVKLKFDDAVLQETKDRTSVSNETVSLELFKMNWKNRQSNNTPRHSDINYIMENGLWELVPSLYDYYTAENMSAQPRPIDERFPIILSLLPYDAAVSFIYKDYARLHEFAFPLIKSNRLFSAKKVLSLLQEGYLDLAVELLTTQMNFYTLDDVKEMEMIIKHLDSLPDKGKIAEVKSGIFSSRMEHKYICPQGHKNEVSDGFCTDPSCMMNIKGLTIYQVRIIDKFKERVGVIKRLLDN